MRDHEDDDDFMGVVAETLFFFSFFRKSNLLPETDKEMIFKERI